MVNQKIGASNLRLRVENLPDTANHIAHQAHGAVRSEKRTPEVSLLRYAGALADARPAKVRPRVAWIVTVDDIVAVAFAEDRSKAKWQCVKAWRDADYGTDGRWPSISVGRAKSYDKFPQANEKCRCWSEQYVIDEIGRIGRLRS